ncbi:MAG: hypothetical protein RL211_1300 [Pseudomonadota bacterium]|jgi:hypothetical protein
MTSIPSNVHCTALQTRPGISRIELQVQSWPRQIRRQPISVWTLLKDALGTRSSAITEPDESFVTTRPAPLLAMQEQQYEVQIDRRSAVPQEQQAQRKKQHAMRIIGRDLPQIHTLIGSLWGHQECSNYIQGLVMTGGDGKYSRPPRLKIDALTALLELDRLHDMHLVQLCDAATESVTG